MSPIISPASDLGRQFPGCTSVNGGDRVQNSTRQLEFERQNSREEEASESKRFRDLWAGGRGVHARLSVLVCKCEGGNCERPIKEPPEIMSQNKS